MTTTTTTITTTRTTTINEIRSVAVTVTDQDRTLDFYVGTLGFEKRMDAPISDDFRWIEIAPPGATVSMELTPTSTDASAGVDSGIRLTSRDIDTEHAAFKDRGVDVDDMLRWPDMPAMFTFRDVDGNTLYVVETE